ncbi:MAG: IS110 family transposase [Thermomicrobiales bacterium]|nr:IS110 family transposase [Thermomicrobiales bacterium]MCO5219013.1 IS110 family transposase [Thermomicrobiales bacterium]MCO5224276.1 IS110 family transposase [Thermomicrobiales bacterium]MCO5225383.1 IS110 family transposase [Thermomicrobiales bacterium]MCO5227898.1 IS110 family transposase [Thermomicrobiales bacterium]
MLVSGGCWVGIDVSKQWLDVCITSQGTPFRVTNDVAGFTRIHRALQTQSVAGVVFEHTGQYSEPLWRWLRDVHVHPSLVHPNHISNYRKSGFSRAKTDRSDARLLAAFGEERRPRITLCRTATEQALHDLLHARRGVVNARIAAKQRMRASWSPELTQTHHEFMTSVTRQIQFLEQEITRTIASDPQTHYRADLLQSVKGIGLIRSALLIADLPELGTIDRKKIAMLVGLAPIANDSGQSSKPRFTAGGRSQIRSELVMAARTPRVDPAIRAHRAPLLMRHEHKVKSDTATARWLLTVLNAMIRDGLRWEETESAKNAAKEAQAA